MKYCIIKSNLSSSHRFVNKCDFCLWIDITYHGLIGLVRKGLANHFYLDQIYLHRFVKKELFLDKYILSQSNKPWPVQCKRGRAIYCNLNCNIGRLLPGRRQNTSYLH